MYRLKKTASKLVASYFATLKKTYEKFINKKWEERKDVYQKKADFLKESVSEWNKLTEKGRFDFLCAKPPAGDKARITSFFRTESTRPYTTSSYSYTTVSSSTTTASSTVRFQNDTVGVQIPNANSAMNREEFLDGKENRLIGEFFQSTSVNSARFFSMNDQTSDKALMSALKSLVYKWSDHSKIRKSYESGKTWRKDSKLINLLGKIDNSFAELAGYFTSVSKIESTNNMDTFAISQTYLRKAENVARILVLIGKITGDLNTDLNNKLKKRIRQQKKVIEKTFTRNPYELVKLSCENDTHLTWEDAFDRIIDMENCREKIKVSYETLISIAKLLSCSIATDIRELGINLTAEQIAHITRLPPVVYCHYSVGRGGGGIHKLR